jgi:lysyl-tRNA synthetase class 2
MIEEEAVRRGRLEHLRQSGADPYPSGSSRSHRMSDVLQTFESLLSAKTQVTVCGRLRTIRKHGGLTFAQCEDGSGVIQVALRRDHVGEEAYQFFHDTVDMGDFVEARGTAFLTKTGQQTLDLESYRIITKSLLPMPEKWHGLTDTEARYRQRYLDLIANAQVRAIFKTRSTIVSAMRAFLDTRGFLEVETPILQAIPGGASAKPFITHHNALDADMYLRIAPELFLKRCVVGGFERVYEVARCFRNEGVDHAHNPEFTQIEGYAAYMDYVGLMELLEEMLREVIVKCGLDLAAVPYEGHVLDFEKPWPRIKFRDAMLAHAKIDIEEFPDRESIARQAAKMGVPVEKSDGHTTIIDNVYKHFVRPNVIQPTYIIDYPVEISPLAKRKAEDPRYVEMFQLVCGGVENIKAFSELNDPIDQEERFRLQAEARERGDEEAQFGDDDFVEALKHGMPPTAGFGIGIDRLAAMLTNSHSLKEVILFPTLKPQV